MNFLHCRCHVRGHTCFTCMHFAWITRFRREDLYATTIHIFYFMKFLSSRPDFRVQNRTFLHAKENVYRNLPDLKMWSQLRMRLFQSSFAHVFPREKGANGRRLEFSSNRNVYVNTCLHAIAFLSFVRDYATETYGMPKRPRFVVVISHFLINKA